MGNKSQSWCIFLCCGPRSRSVAPACAEWFGQTAISVTVLPLLFYVPEPYPVVVLTPCWFALDQKKDSLPRDFRPHRRFLLYDGQITITITGNLSAWFSYGIQCFAHFLQLLRYFYIFLIFWRYIWIYLYRLQSLVGADVNINATFVSSHEVLGLTTCLRAVAANRPKSGVPAPTWDLNPQSRGGA